MTEPTRAARHSRWAWAALLLAVVAVGGGALAALSGGSDPTPLSTPAAATAATSTGGQTQASSAALSLIKQVSDKPLLDGGKPAVFFMGAHFCPFCASERWAFVKATSRFGTWRGLRPLRSEDGGEFGSLPSYDFVHATFRSDAFSLRHKEVADVHGNRLQSLDGFESKLVNAYNPRGSIPFVVAGSAAGQYTVDLAYSPALLQGETFDGLRARLIVSPVDERLCATMRS